MTVLICDDDASTRFAVTRLLTRHLDCAVIECSNGTDAIARLDVEEVSLMLLDIEMPEMSGVEVLAAVRASAARRYLPVVMMSRERREEVVLALVRLGIDGYVLKPLRADKVLAVIEPLWQRIARQRDAAAAGTAVDAGAPFVVVDGDPDVRRVFAERAHGLRPVLEADSGSAAIALLKREPAATVFVGSHLGLLTRDRLVAKLRTVAAPRRIWAVALLDANPEDGSIPDGCDGSMRRLDDPAAFRAALLRFSPMPGPLGAAGVRFGDAEDSLAEGAHQICSMMLDLSIAATSGRVTVDAGDAVSATVGLTGPAAMRLSTTVPVPSAVWLAGRMFGKPAEATTEEDWQTAVGELCQMVSLRVREFLEAHEVPCECEAPLVRRGPSDWLREPPGGPALRLSFEVPGRGITLLFALDVGP